MRFLSGYANLAKLFCSLLTIVLAATSSASSEGTPSAHRYKAKSAEFPPKCFRITMNLFCCSVVVVVSRCRHVSSHLFVFFFLRCLVEIMDNGNVEMLVNAGQELDSARDCTYKFSINLVMRKPEYRTNAVNYPYGIQYISLLSILRTLRHKWLSTRLLRIHSLFLFVRLLVFFCC